MIAVGLDKVRSDACLLIWDLAAASQTAEPRPVYSYLSNEVVLSTAFMARDPRSLLCGSYKFLREIDLRSPNPVFQCAAKCAHGISVNPNNDNYFASYSEDGAFALWDRRRLKTGADAGGGGSSHNGEPVLYMNRMFGEINRKSHTACFRFSTKTVSEFTILHDGDVLRRWRLGHIPGSNVETPAMRRNSTRNGGSHDAQLSYMSKQDNLFVSRVLDIRTDYDKVVSFDYAYDDHHPGRKLDFMCIRQSGQVFRMNVIESPDVVRFDPYNDVAVVDPTQVSILGENADEALSGSLHKLTIGDEGDDTRHTADSDHEDGDGQSDDQKAYDDRSFEGLVGYHDVLSGDISTLMRLRAARGYHTDCDANVEFFTNVEKNENLRYTWRWLSLATKSEKKGSMSRQSDSARFDLGYEGVMGIWEGVKGLEGQNRLIGKWAADMTMAEKETLFNETVEHIVKARKRRVFTAVNTKRDAHRQLCLRVSGWNFETSELEAKIKELEANGEHEKAAGWAVFHGDVSRAVTALARSRKERLRLMSTAVAGYLAYRDSDVNSPWREQCRVLATELENPYLRAIFAYIADSSWLDVLDEGSLPLVERLGIAFRFLPDDELTAFLSRLTEKAIARGDLDGLILTGVTPQAVDLIQSYVDKTSDVQTASLIVSFGTPRYFKDKRTRHWIEEYRRLLNSWRMFSNRAKFDVARTQLSQTLGNVITAKEVPKQIYLRCNHCKNVITAPSDEHAAESHKPQTDALSRCEHCNNPLPRCAVCLLPMGGPLPNFRLGTDGTDDRARYFERWPTFCLSCNHGFHAGHAKEWFMKYDICPVPDCTCLCNNI